MNLEKLFQMQRQLDERILDEHPEIKDKNNLDWKILALQVELGECANEWRGFKKWSKDQEPRTHEIVVQCDICQEWTDYPHEVDGITENRNPLLEEYVDCLHFILSIGLELGINGPYVIGNYTAPNVTRQFNFVFHDASKLDEAISDDHPEEDVLEIYDELVRGFLGLGEMLGFSRDQIEQAYFDKNEINHQRQEAGY